VEEMPFRIGVPELIIILVVIMIIFGVGKLPQVSGAIGKGLKEFRKGQSGLDETTKETEAEEKEEPKKE